MCAWDSSFRALPSETLALRVEDFVLPETGPGTVRIHRSLDEDGQDGMTKTGRERTISVPTALVVVLCEYLGERTTGPLVTTQSGNPPALSNWLRALCRSCDKLGVGRIAPYDFRHSCASMLLAETKAPGAVADRLGNSVEVLLRYYAAALDGQDRIVADAAERLFG